MQNYPNMNKTIAKTIQNHPNLAKTTQILAKPPKRNLIHSKPANFIKTTPIQVKLLKANHIF